MSVILGEMMGNKSKKKKKARKGAFKSDLPFEEAVKRTVEKRG